MSRRAPILLGLLALLASGCAGYPSYTAVGAGELGADRSRPIRFPVSSAFLGISEQEDGKHRLEVALSVTNRAAQPATFDLASVVLEEGSLRQRFPLSAASSLGQQLPDRPPRLEPGETRSLALTFLLPPNYDFEQLRGFRVLWRMQAGAPPIPCAARFARYQPPPVYYVGYPVIYYPHVSVSYGIAYGYCP